MVVAVVAVLIALGGGGAAGYFYAQSDSKADNGGSSDIARGSDGNPESGADEETAEVHNDYEQDELEGDWLTAIEFDTPDYPWEEIDEESIEFNSRTFREGENFNFESPNEHEAYILSGVINNLIVTTEPNRFEESIRATIQEFKTQEMLMYPSLLKEDIEFTSHEVDGYDAMLGETTIEWWSQPDHEEQYTSVAVLIISGGAYDAVGGLVSVPEHAEEHYQPAVDLLLEADVEAD